MLKTHKTFIVAAMMVLLVAPQVSAYYKQEGSNKSEIPSFGIAGNVPLTQVGTGNAPKTRSSGSDKLHIALSQIIPSKWNLFLSTNSPYCNSVQWEGQKDSSWVQTLGKVAQATNTRVLVDWNLKAVLVISQGKTTTKSVFFNPRTDIDSSKIVAIPVTPSLVDETNFVKNMPPINCLKKTNRLCSKRDKN